MRGADWRELPRKRLRSSLTKQWRERAYRHSWLANDCRPAMTSCPPYHAMAPIEPKPRNIIRDANDELYNFNLTDAMSIASYAAAIMLHSRLSTALRFWVW